jgi:tetratricopeptide (TPR) repeat protein
LTTVGDREALLEEAQRALDLVERSPREALAAADAVLAHVPRQRGPEAVATAQRAAGLALRNLGDLPSAETRLRSGIRSAARTAPQQAAEARMSLAFVLLEEGRTRDALTQADRAASALTGLAAARLTSQRALILQRCGHTREALAAYDRALPVLRRADDRVWEARLRNNRGLLNAYRGAFGQAQSDLRRALELAYALDADLLVAETRWNLGFVASLRGNVIEALEGYDNAEAAFAELGLPDARLLLDRCAVLLGVGLHEEAMRSARQAIDVLQAAGALADSAEGFVVLAQAELALGLHDRAAAAAGHAVTMLSGQGRPGWVLLARYVGIRARAAMVADGDLVRTASQLSDDLGAAHWREEQVDALLIAGTSAIAIGRHERGEALLARARRARRSGSVGLRARGWWAEALLRAHRGDRVGALRAVNCGLRLVRQAQVVLGATELKAHMAVHGERLAELGLTLALEGGRPSVVLRQAEYFRAGGLHAIPVRPPTDPVLATLLAELRLATAAEDDRRLHGATDVSAPHSRASIERRVQARARTIGSFEGYRLSTRAIDLRQLKVALADRALVEYVVIDGQVTAVTVVDGRTRLHRLGGIDAVRLEAEALHFALSRVIAGASSPSLTHALNHAASRLDELLLAALPATIGRDLVICPTGVLQSIPWGVLPGLHGRGVTVTPSAALWLRASERHNHGDGRVVLVAGPELEFAATEVRGVSQLYRGSSVLAGEDAHTEQVLAAIEGASIAHIAAHGDLRSDNPMFSALKLSGGPMTVYDLERLHAVPPLVVLPACRSAVGVVRTGDEILGLASALLGLGTRSVIAAVVPVPDRETSSLMHRFHRHLAAGIAARHALAAASAEGLDMGSRVGQAFVCLGSD